MISEKVAALLERLFPEGAHAEVEAGVLSGGATVGGETVALAGVVDGTALGVNEVVRLSRALLEVLERQPKRPIVLLIDTRGQRMELRDELLGLNQYLAHLCRVLEMARQREHRLVAVVAGEALGGALIATGLMAQEVIALEEANPMVMPMAGIAAVTKCCTTMLEELSARNPVFTPGADAFYRMGGIDRLRPADPAAALAEALNEPVRLADHRAAQGEGRGGRTKARNVAERVVALP
ncbi:MAG TPA: biotin-independent malonate decarboxylase subunit gamma [Chthoniobacteraceae bacterium]|nr:biotin-independent malonate decarboxylase subunit gamma [Chthoniobacteraceae bacterium]